MGSGAREELLAGARVRQSRGQIDLCRATAVIRDKASREADYRSALGVNPALVAQLFQSAASQTVTTLDPQMRSFFVAAGLSVKNATTLTS